MRGFALLARKSSRAEAPSKAAQTGDQSLELDEDLFTAPAAPAGGEDKTPRSLLREAHEQLNQLDGVKAALRRLIDPLDKAVGDCEAAQSELRAVQTSKAELAAEVVVQRGKATDLEKRLAQQTGESILQREENRRLGERLAAAEQRTAELEQVVTEAHGLLLARAEQLREQERRYGELAAERDALQAQLAELQSALRTREAELEDVARLRMTYAERNAALARAFTAKEAALAQAAQANAALGEQIIALEGATIAAERTIEQLAAALQLEKLDRAAVEDALASARRDAAKAMREVMALQQNQAQPARPRRAANAA